ncbi:hypothetical protein Pla175_27830 [Pirellulimonas nuda]|uniref:Uncharacterized protein n=1 Tax=Pirellulimonas nuda TaxID=2528009 RepID=A0A518DD62_9BACT|nr:hypothetical protein [Pirellulimonas nuda]QDU89393.1 hypothetical protein Pla175_27830 [Pirellulimonas nuda]
MRRNRLWIAALATTALATSGWGAEPAGSVAQSFEGVLEESDAFMVDWQVAPSSCGVAADCGGCFGGDRCGDAIHCSSRGWGGCCPPNTGLLGCGLLTHDPCSQGCPLPGLLLGCIACPTEPCFDNFISPMTNPVYFEDPRNVTEVRGIFLQHHVPQGAGGGDIQLYAAQVRARLSERLSLIATRDGYAVSSNPLIDDGWADIDLGFKYALFRDEENQRLLSGGFTYSLPVGSTRTLQGLGDGVFNLFLTGGAEVCDCGHYVSAFGGLIPVDGDANSSFNYWSNHLDYQFRRGWYALAEMNLYHWTGSGDGRLGLSGVEGGDLFNLGSADVAGNDIVTAAFGGKYKPNRKTEIGVAWENPVTQRRDVLQNRLTVDLILRF